MYGMNSMGSIGGMNGLGGAYGYPPPSFPTGFQNSFSGQVIPQTPATQNGVQDLVSVQTIEQVEQVQVQPGQRRIVMVQNDPVIAARVADNMGLVSTQYYQLTPYDPHAVASLSPTQNYITEEQFDQRLEQRLASFAESLKSEPVKEEKKGASK